MDAIDPGAVEELLTLAAGHVSRGELPSVQVALLHRGQVVASDTFGAPDDARYVLFSVSKALTAGAVWVLLSEGAISPRTAVADIVPEFGDKRAVTVEDLLVHTAGFPRAPMRPEEGADPAARRQRFAEWRLEWEPGGRTAYHPTSAHWVLADIVERASGRPFAAFVAERVTGPLGLPELGFDVDGPDVLDVEAVGAAPDPGAIGAEVAATLGEIGPEILLRYNDPAVRRAAVPGAGAIGRASDVARYFQALLDDRIGVWEPAVLADATSAIRNVHVDPLRGVPANRSLGLVVGGDDGHGWVRELGQSTGPRAFGASGIGGQVAWADPDTGISFCVLTNGIDRDVVRAFLRTHELSTIAGRCVSAVSR